MDRTKSLSRRLRRTPTNAERVLWAEIRGRKAGGHKFRRQHPIGTYVVDFCCVEKNLVVEVDGDVHRFKEARDVERERYLDVMGYTLLRVHNHEVLNDIQGVVARICDLLRER